MNSLSDDLYDIEKRPPNWELRFNMSIGLALYVAVSGVAPLFILHWLGVRQWVLIGIPLLASVTVVWWAVRGLKRRGVEAKRLYVTHGGNLTGTSNLLFGQMTYEISPDGRWKWPERTYSSD